MNPARVLIIEDDPRDAELFRRLLESAGYQIEIATRPAAGLARARSGDFAAVLTDLNLGPERDEGRSLVIQLHAIDPHLPVILMTGGHTPDMAIEVIKLGAFDYFSKPLDPFDPNFCEELAEMVDHAVASKRLSAEVKLPDETAPGDQLTGDRIVGKSRAMQNVYKEIGRVATRPVTVLIRGETGTGKELVARAIYNHSDRPNQPFIVVNCAAIPEHLLESELFGHESGAFTGAKSSRLGRFELAHGGTVFLDEIGDMNLKLQQKLLRVLQEGTIERLGGKAPIAVDARVIAATHRDLETAV